MDWVQNTGRSLGVVIITKRSNKISSGFVNKVVLMCDRSGEYRVKDSSRVTGTKKCKCPFELEGKFSKEHEYWTLRVLCDEHNHQLIKYMEGHPYVKRLSENEISLVEDLSRKNVAPRDILAILKERNVNNVSTIKNIYNIRQKLRMVEQVGKSPMQVLVSLLHSNGYVYEFCTNVSNELENLFFVHPTSFDIWRAFPHVLLIDATYKTNKYNMPFVQIVGVTSTRMTFSIGFAFIENEREANYTWVLNFLKLTLDACMHPRVIVKKITRGRPRLKNKQQKKRVDPTTQEPRRYSYSAASNFVELDSIKEPMRHSSYVMDLNQESMGDCSYVIDLNEEPTKNNPFVIDLNEEPTNDNSYLNFQTYYSHPLMSQIPNMFHPYITRIQNVMSEGNCGFRAISVCLGYGEDQWLNIRHQLLDELNNGKDAYTQVFTADFDNVYRSLCFSSSPAPKEHWMIMPLTGLLIANKFGVIVHCLSLQGCTTCFPLWKGLGEFQHHQALTIAHIYGNHFVMVQLQGQYPMPPITAYWNYYKSPYAAG